ncbi:MAG: hypothetical protein ABWY19_15020 [Marmoricola sp.]
MLRKTVGSVGALAQEAVTTAVNVVRHPIGSASMAVGFAKGVAGAGVDLVRGSTVDAPSAPEQAVVPQQAAAPETRAAAPEAPEAPAVDPRDELPGPDLAQFEPPQPDELPEPIVIEADDHPAPGDGESGEPFHHEPKPASRDVAHGDPGTDFEQADGFEDEIPADLRPE